MVSTYGKIIFVVLFCTELIMACSPTVETRNLVSCWNVNDLPEGRVKGVGIFIINMHGLSLQSPDCSDSSGHNKFELSHEPKNRVRSFLLGIDNKVRYAKFNFEGNVKIVGNRHLLIIEKINNIEATKEPYWISDLQKSLQ